jgi:hypothetical protein
MYETVQVNYLIPFHRPIFSEHSQNEYNKPDSSLDIKTPQQLTNMNATFACTHETTAL